MAEVKFKVTRESKGGGEYRHGLEFDTDSLAVSRIQDIDFTSTWHAQSIIREVRFSGFEPLRFQEGMNGEVGKWLPSPAAKADWRKRRKYWRSFTEASPDDKMSRRSAQPGGGTNHLIKFRITLVLQDGTEIFVDPIIDERPT